MQERWWLLGRKFATTPLRKTNTGKSASSSMRTAPFSHRTDSSPKLGKLDVGADKDFSPSHHLLPDRRARGGAKSLDENCQQSQKS